MNNSELLKLVNRIGIKEYNDKVIFFNAELIYKELFERMYKEDIQRLVKEYKKLRNEKKLDFFS